MNCSPVLRFKTLLPTDAHKLFCSHGFYFAGIGDDAGFPFGNFVLHTYYSTVERWLSNLKRFDVLYQNENTLSINQWFNFVILNSFSQKYRSALLIIQ